MDRKKVLRSNFELVKQSSELSERCRSVVALYSQTETSQKKVAAILKMPLYEVRKHISKATFFVKKVTKDPEFVKAMEILRKV